MDQRNMNLAEQQALRYSAQKVKIYPDWISVNDRLPNDDKEYLFVTKWNSIFLGQYYEGRWMLNIEEDECMPGVTHWMNLPKAPKS